MLQLTLSVVDFVRNDVVEGVSFHKAPDAFLRTRVHARVLFASDEDQTVFGTRSEETFSVSHEAVGLENTFAEYDTFRNCPSKTRIVPMNRSKTIANTPYFILKPGNTACHYLLNQTC